MNIRKKLMLSFAASGLLAAMLGICAWVGIARVTDALDQSVTVTTTRVALASDIKLSILNMRFGERGILLFARIHGEEKRVASKKVYDTAAARLAEDARTLRPLLLSDKERALLSSIESSAATYRRVRVNIDRLVADDKLDEATQMDMTQLVAPGTAAVKAAEELYSDQQAYFDGAVHKADTTAKASKTAVAIFLTACIALGLALSFVVSSGISGPLQGAVHVLEQVADGDLTASLDVSPTGEVGRMASSVNHATTRLRTTLLRVRESAAHASDSSRHLAEGAATIAAGSQRQAASIEQTAASLEQITAAVQKNAQHAHEASQLALGSKDSADRGQQVVSQAVAAMEEIDQASAKIFAITSTIDEIAFQTNLLAVNAAVEAARAGPEGRGFAVVAAEVRGLAQRTADAARQIKGLIRDSQQKVARGVQLVNRSGENLQHIVLSTNQVTDLVAGMAQSAAEQTTGIEQIHSALTEIERTTQSNSGQTEQLSGTAQTLAEQASQLFEMVESFSLGQIGQSSRTEPKRAQSNLVPAGRAAAPRGRARLRASA